MTTKNRCAVPRTAERRHDAVNPVDPRVTAVQKIARHPGCARAQEGRQSIAEGVNPRRTAHDHRQTLEGRQRPLRPVAAPTAPCHFHPQRRAPRSWCPGERTPGAKASRTRIPPRLTSALLLWPLFVCPGCIQFASAWANITGGDVIEPEYKLTQGPLLVLIEDPRGDVSEPRALRELHATISDIFLEFKVNHRIIPREERERLERAEKSYGKLSIREIGEKLGAEQVLYIRVEKFTLQSEPGAPIFKGEFIARVKVLSTEQEKDVRLWPREPSGKRISVTTPPISSEGDKTASDVAKELAIKMGQAITENFYEHRSLDGKKK